MAELKLTNNPCKFCNGEIDEGKPLCGDLVDLGDVCCMVKGLTGLPKRGIKTIKMQSTSCILK